MKNGNLQDSDLYLAKNIKSKSVEKCRRKCVEKTEKMKYYRESSLKNFF